MVGVPLDSGYEWWEELVPCCIDGSGFDFLRGPINGSLAKVEKHFSPTRTCDDNVRFFSQVSQSSDALSIGSTPTSCVDCRKRKKKRRDETDVVTSVSYGVVSFSSWSKAIFSSVTCIIRIRGPSQLERVRTSRPAPISLPLLYFGVFN